MSFPTSHYGKDTRSGAQNCRDAWLQHLRRAGHCRCVRSRMHNFVFGSLSRWANARWATHDSKIPSLNHQPRQLAEPGARPLAPQRPGATCPSTIFFFSYSAEANHPRNAPSCGGQPDPTLHRSRSADVFQSAGTARDFAHSLMDWMSSERVTLRGWVLRTSAKRMSVESCCFWLKAV